MPLKPWLTIIAIVLILAFAFQGSRGLWEPDEGRYVRCAYEMIQSGDWLIPRLNGTPHFTKPPLTYWIIASGLTLFGMNEWGARFFHAISFILTAFMAWYMAAIMWDNRTGLLSALVYVSMVFPYTGANTLTTDSILTCFETAAMLSFWMCIVKYRDHALQSTLWGALMSLFLGLAFLTKGPPGLLPLLAGAAYLALSLQKRTRSYVTITLGCIIFAAIALPWYLLVILKYKGLLSYFINNEIIGRIITGGHTRNAGLFGAFKIYPHTLFLGALPWSCFWVIWGWRNRASLVTFGWWKQLRQRDTALFIAVWFLLPLFCFVVSRSRLPLYVLPLFVPLAFATAKTLLLQYPEQASSLALLRGKPARYLVLFLVVLISSRAITAHLNPARDSRFIWQHISRVIHAHVGDSPYALSVVDLNYEGLTFYSRRMIEMIEIKPDNRHNFYLRKNLQQKCDELINNNATQIFLADRIDAKKVTAELDRRGIAHVTERGPFDYYLIFCRTASAFNAGAGGPAAQINGTAADTALSAPEG
jgi:4-amino-4-deoxy-L-arabinose transferase-like glycosyltransferase